MHSHKNTSRFFLSKICLVIALLFAGSICIGASGSISEDHKRLIVEFIEYVYLKYRKPVLLRQIYLDNIDSFESYANNYRFWYTFLDKEFLGDFWNCKYGDLNLSIGPKGQIECFVNGSLYTVVNKPYSCGSFEAILKDKCCDESLYATEGQPYFTNSAYDEELSSILFSAIKESFDTLRYRVDAVYNDGGIKRMFMHMYEYNTENGLVKICGCHNRSAKYFTEIMEKECRIFCSRHNISDIIFDYSNISDFESNFVNNFINRFSELSFPLEIRDGRVESQYVISEQYLNSLEIVKYIDNNYDWVNNCTVSCNVLGTMKIKNGFDVYIAVTYLRTNIPTVIRLRFNMNGDLISKNIFPKNLYFESDSSYY